ALISTIIAFVFAVPLIFFAARNLTNSWPLRIFTKRLMEFLRAFPEIVIAGLFASITVMAASMLQEEGVLADKAAA
ncbi:hypothetical protein AB9E32_35275, partial [Rhizobium leguminosarum]